MDIDAQHYFSILMDIGWSATFFEIYGLEYNKKGALILYDYL